MYTYSRIDPPNEQANPRAPQWHRPLAHLRSRVARARAVGSRTPHAKPTHANVPDDSEARPHMPLSARGETDAPTVRDMLDAEASRQTAHIFLDLAASHDRSDLS